MKLIAAATALISIMSYPILMGITNLFAPETLSSNFFGDKSDPLSNISAAIAPFTVALSILLLGAANRINYHYSAKDNPNITPTKLKAMTFLMSVLWVILSLTSIIVTAFIFFIMRLGR